ncbi:MAG: hypothetical protein RM049_35170 [Nostoc sp. DedQUE04]|uniref:hypothetical protein n=1 Tax=Nostoc sp. DedQUE04 TaxID=3075390 RepID=UPI002AD34824|nr:hypothetical protein [Nostoc sp. DedQUE04]MDZ8140476.1 hypothetical protein [Nostoc sp. DedQUE04]
MKSSHLKSLKYLSAKYEQMCRFAMVRAPAVADRISRLRNNKNLEKTAKAVLKGLGVLKRSYLTTVEEKLLGLIEREYGISD